MSECQNQAQKTWLGTAIFFSNRIFLGKIINLDKWGIKKKFDDYDW